MYKNDQDSGKLVESTVGRFIFNQGIPQDLGFIDREVDPYSLEVDFLCDKKKLGVIIDKCYRKHGNTGTVIMLDYIKSMGYKYSTKAAVTISVSDMEIPEAKESIIAQAETDVDKYEKACLLYTSQRTYRLLKWKQQTQQVHIRMQMLLYHSLLL